MNNFTQQWRTQVRQVSTTVAYDYTYLIDEINLLAPRILADIASRRLQESYTFYLYGPNFINHKKTIEQEVAGRMRAYELTGYRIFISEIGTLAELINYPMLRGVRVNIAAVN